MTNISFKLSHRAKAISPSPTLAVDAKAKALKAAGEDVCGFGAGEPDFDTPDFIKQACIKALQDGKTKYAPAAGLPALREALASRYREERGIEGATAASVIISPGGKYSCYLAILAVCGPGDEVIIPSPYWVSYPEMVKLADAKPVVVAATEENDFKLTLEQLEGAINDKTRLLILNSPSNPTGSLYTRAELEAMVELCLKHDVYILSDEIYEYLLYDGAEHVSPASFSAEAASRVIIASGFSKTYSMTGWRLGTLLAPEPIAKAIADLQSQTTSNATTFAQYGALEAVIQPDKARAAVNEMLLVFDKRRLHLWESLNAIDGISCRRAQGAFYLFPNISSFGKTSTDFSAELLEKELTAVVPGIAFGADANVRFSYAVSDEIIDKGIERLVRFCKSL